ncbi:TonB-dependent siderophore receptor [Luteimonas salinilitoris]|uniref:TonB-dependent siderophore receptor n=1 Tax=Luteimonas salinilitoris TaxID=3237697 RepID=A0ABV4HV62_9GAMM
MASRPRTSGFPRSPVPIAAPVGAVLLACASFASAQEAGLRIDGVADESAWEDAQTFTDFMLTQPLTPLYDGKVIAVQVYPRRDEVSTCRFSTLCAIAPAATALVAPAQDLASEEAADSPSEQEEPATDAPTTLRRSDENVVTQADDAFGTSIGRETIGIYSSSSVRGFSPTEAGNVRIDGLYFDQVWPLSPRIRRSTSIRVGLSAQNYPFPAPTGVIDYAFRTPGDEASLSVSLGGDSDGGANLEIDAVLPLRERTLSIGMGAALYGNERYDGTSSTEHVEAAALRWTPTMAIEIVPFWSRAYLRDYEIGPWYVPAGPYLPPHIPRRRFNGPHWALYERAAVNYGVFGRADLAKGWQLRAGVFHSHYDVDRDAYAFLTDLQPDGTGRFEVFADPAFKTASTSSEIRLSRRFSEGPRLHVLHANLRARDRSRRYGGTDVIDLGRSYIGDIIDVPEPVYDFGPQTHDTVRQWTAGLAYEGRWLDVGELSAGIQRSDYRKTIDQPGLPRAETGATPWLFNATIAGYLSERLAVYAGYTRGLEESGVAPQIASNRNAALPAILTTQHDAGFRYRFTDRLRLVAGVFDVRKPYFSLDETDLYRELGEVRSRGFEASLSGGLGKNLDVVIGAVLMRPRVHGEDVDADRVGERPVGLAERQFDLNVDWRPPGMEGVSLDLGVSHIGAMPATRDNRVELPAHTLVDLGGRYKFRLAGRNASFRVSIRNVFDEYAFDLRGAGTYHFIPGRLASAYLTVDF